MKDQGGGQLKIIDFGTAQDLSVTPTPKVLTGTPEFVGRHAYIIQVACCCTLNNYYSS